MDLIPESEGGEYFVINGNMCRLKDAGLSYGKGKGDSPET